MGRQWAAKVQNEIVFLRSLVVQLHTMVFVVRDLLKILAESLTQTGAPCFMYSDFPEHTPVPVRIACHAEESQGSRMYINFFKRHCSEEGRECLNPNISSRDGREEIRWVRAMSLPTCYALRKTKIWMNVVLTISTHADVFRSVVDDLQHRRITVGRSSHYRNCDTNWLRGREFL